MTSVHIPPLTLPARIGDLIQLADSVPADEIMDFLPEFWCRIEGIEDHEVCLRHLLVLGTLVNRALFEISRVPEDVDAII